MDDTYLWAERLEFLQIQVSEVETALAKEGLFTNGDNTECACSHSCPNAEMEVGKQHVKVQRPTHTIKVLGASMGSSVAVTIAAMQQKMRGVLAANKSAFRGKGTLAQQAKMADVLIRPAALWGCPMRAFVAFTLDVGYQGATTQNLPPTRRSRNLLDAKGRGTGESFVAGLEQCEPFAYNLFHVKPYDSFQHDALGQVM